MTTLLAWLASYYPLPAPLIERLQPVIKEKRFARREFLLKAGKVCRHIYYVQKGLLRCYYDMDGLDISASFVKEGEIGVVAESFLLQKESHEHIQAMEDSIVYTISHADLEKLYRDFPELNIIARLIIGKCFILSEKRLSMIRMRRAKDRYSWLMAHESILIRRVPSKYLASYLGITEVKMSIVKKRNS